MASILVSPVRIAGRRRTAGDFGVNHGRISNFGKKCYQTSSKDHYGRGEERIDSIMFMVLKSIARK